MESPFLTKAEAAEYLRLSPKGLSRLSIPRIKVGRLVRYERADLDEYMNKMKTAGGIRLGRSYRKPIKMPRGAIGSGKVDLSPLFA